MNELESKVKLRGQKISITAIKVSLREREFQYSEEKEKKKE